MGCISSCNKNVNEQFHSNNVIDANIIDHSLPDNNINEYEQQTNLKARACFGAGCYWGTQKYFYHDFGKKNKAIGEIINSAVGFMGPQDASNNPTYKEVCSGYTGHVEVYDFEYSGGLVYYEALVRFFFQFHDPTTQKRQGNDVGTQYASVIYCYDETQYNIVMKVKNELQILLNEDKISCYETKTVHTDIRMATIFYPAHQEHQDYLEKNPKGYCNHRIRFKEWPTI